MPGGKDVTFNGFFAVDVPAAAKGGESIDEVSVVTERNCTVVHPIVPGRTPESAVPPALNNLPVLRFDKLLGG